jgi:cytochrome P450 family 103
LVIFSVCVEDIPFFTEFVYSTTRVFSFRFTAEEIPEIESSASQLMDYTERLASARRAAPRDDFLSTYLVAADQAGEMSPLEILIQLLFVIVAGMMRPVALPPSGRLSCSSTESSGKQCVAIPVWCRVAEALRFEPSVASVSRFALRGHRIRWLRSRRLPIHDAFDHVGDAR